MKTLVIGVTLAFAVGACGEPSASTPPDVSQPPMTTPTNETVATPPESDPPIVGNASSDGLGAFFTLSGVGAVIEATVVDKLGSEAVLNEFGAVDYVGRSENPDDWTTVLGFPVVVLDDIDIVEQIGGSTKADGVVPRIQRDTSANRPVEVLAPVGVFEKGQRYQFWISASQIEDLKTYLVFTEDGRLLPGLGLVDPEADFGVIEQFTGLHRQASLVLMAQEMNAASEGNPQGELMDLASGTVPGI